MKLKIALQTLALLPLWLLLMNFNTIGVQHPAADHLGAGKSTYKIKKVVLDAGHGGKDPGCIGAISKEKDNTLAIILQLGKKIKREFPDVEVIYTRDKDVFIELNERAAIANRNNADLFISVHCNAISNNRIAGAETYVMGLHTAAHNLEVAKRENASIYLEDNYQQNYGGYDPNSPEAHIMGSMWQSAYLEQSILLAGFIQQQAKDIAQRYDRGVKQAGFLVLRETAMPAILVESGYLTNLAEEKYIVSEEGREALAESIFQGFKSYKVQMEGHPGSTPVAATPKKAPAPAPVANAGTSGPKATASAITSTTTAKGAPDSGFRILLLSWPSKLDVKTGRLALLSDIIEEKRGSEYQYFVGTFASRNEAEKVLGDIHNLGFRTAVIQANN
ncbi:MAG: N-acetylmuramoyl-L-alanine amidase [Lewinellaceae bacterium]|nr:N-acetylmuramoyl-L-alanine amidase [Lewinellaceae bacterium]